MRNGISSGADHAAYMRYIPGRAGVHGFCGRDRGLFRDLGRIVVGCAGHGAVFFDGSITPVSAAGPWSLVKAT